jgi:hypothetical protein
VDLLPQTVFNQLLSPSSYNNTLYLFGAGGLANDPVQICPYLRALVR